MRFPPDFLDDIRGRVRLADVVGRKVQLKKRGREYLGLCPFHREKTPSFTVNEEKGFFHCFGCGAHGDAIEFAMRAQGLSFPEAVERLAAEAGLHLPAPSPEAQAQARRQQSLQVVVEAACVWFQRQLSGPAGRHARDYLKGRAVDPETVAHFRIGYAPDSRSALRAALLAGGGSPSREAPSRDGPSREGGGGARFSEEDLIAAGLLIMPEGGGATYDRFRGRIIFPITDRRGRAVAFGGRAMGDGKPKYLNSPETPLFHKGRLLYNLAGAHQAAFESGEIIVAEGYMDVIALHRAGFANAAAPLGTALTEDQMRELWRVAAEPVLCFDGDEAGQRAALAAADRALPLLEPGRSLRFATLPAGEDPDSLLRAHGAPALREVLENARPLAALVWESETAGRALDTPERRAHLEKRLEDRAGGIADPKVRAEYQRYFRDRLGEAFGWSGRGGGPGWARTGSRTGPRTGPRTGMGGGEGTRVRLDSTAVLERILLATLVNHPELLDDMAEDLGKLQFSAPALDKLRQEILDLAARPGLDIGAVKSHLISRGYSEALESVLRRGVVPAAFARPGAPLDEARAGWRHAFGRYRLPIVRAQLREAERAYAESETREDAERLVNLQKHLQEVQAAEGGIDETATPGRADLV